MQIVCKGIICDDNLLCVKFTELMPSAKECIELRLVEDNKYVLIAVDSGAPVSWDNIYGNIN